MKKLKTIITVLVISLTVFGCQMNEELVELKTLNENTNVSNQTRFGQIQTTSLYVRFAQFLDQGQRDNIREQFEQLGLVFLNVEQCLKSNEEAWEVEFVSYSDLIFLSQNINIIPLPTQVGVKNDDDYPNPNGTIRNDNFTIIYNADCDGVLNN